MLGSVLETVETGPSPFVDAVNTLSYPIGFRFLIDRWLSGGQAAIDGFFESPRFPFVDWVSAFNTGTAEATEPLECFPTGAPPGLTAFDHVLASCPSARSYSGPSIPNKPGARSRQSR